MYQDSTPDGCIDVKTTTLDDFIKPDTRIDFAKVDIEGIRKGSPHLSCLMEFNPAKYERPDHFIDQILGEGYQMKSLKDNVEIHTIHK